MLEFHNVCFAYPGNEGIAALRDLTLRIPAGCRCALLGRNGSGKSTLLLHANGILRPQRGAVWFNGAPVQYDRRSLTALRRQVGLVFQDPEQQIVANTVAEDVSYGLFNLGFTEQEVVEQVQKTLKRFGLISLADRPVHRLSLGQKKWVALAGVMAMEPSLLLLDEPTAFLDRPHVHLLLKELAAIHRQGTTVLMATHDLDVAFAWADWIVVLHEGRVAVEGEPERLASQPEVLQELGLGAPVDYWLRRIWRARAPSEVEAGSGQEDLAIVQWLMNLAVTP
ncbi:MAG: ABC transporter ATP-binding protein [Alicyclobacillaceae bacterium]|nr:ABC transporter ATP-binding protein [Alicyclobacillaceae bacterium]